MRSRGECPNLWESGLKRAYHAQTPSFFPCHVLLFPAILPIFKERTHCVAGCCVRTTFMTHQEHCAFLADFLASLPIGFSPTQVCWISWAFVLGTWGSLINRTPEGKQCSPHCLLPPPALHYLLKQLFSALEMARFQSHSHQPQGALVDRGFRRLNTCVWERTTMCPFRTFPQYIYICMERYIADNAYNIYHT